MTHCLDLKGVASEHAHAMKCSPNSWAPYKEQNEGEKRRVRTTHGRLMGWGCKVTDLIILRDVERIEPRTVILLGKYH